MSKNLEFCLDLFKTTSVTTSNYKKLQIIRLLNCSRFLNKALHEITMNLLLGNLSLTLEQKRQLKSFRKLIFILSQKSSLKKKVDSKILSGYINYMKILIPSLEKVLSNT